MTTLKGSYLFLSYRSLERDFAIQLAASLKNEGVRLWMDVMDSGIKVGDDWVQSLQNGLNGCTAMIAILSPEYVASKYCRRELKRADSLGRPIFPIVLRHIEKAEWPLEIQEKQYIDFTGWREKAIFELQLRALLSALHTRFSTEIAGAPDPETRYLTSLIADLESRRGVLEFLELDAVASTAAFRPPIIEDEWGFSLLAEIEEVRDRTQTMTEVSIAEIARTHARFVLLGAPGTGKTTTLRRLATEAARGRLQNPRSTPIPLVLYLPKWPDDASPLDYVRRNWPFESDVSSALSNGEIFLFLDGLNEMGGSGHEKAQDLREWIESTSGPLRIIVTCRTDDYSNLSLGKLPKILISELRNEQIDQFAFNYLGEKAPAFLTRLNQENADPERSLRHLCRIPYMLSAIIYLYELSPIGDLPRNMGTLFRALTRSLWKRERQRGTAGWKPFEKAEERFAKLAFAMVAQGEAIDVSLEYALKHIGDKQLIRLAESASLASVSMEHFRFSHQLIQEYFAAVELEKADIKQVLKPPDRTLRYQWRDATEWDNVVVALLGFTAQPEPWIDYLASCDPELLSLWILSSGRISETAYESVIARLFAVLQHEDWKIRCGAVVALGKIGDARAVSHLTRALYDSYNKLDGGGYEWKYIFPVRRGAAIALGNIGHASAVPALIEAMRDPDNDWATPNVGNTNVRDEARKALRKIGTPEALRALRQKRK